MAICDCSEIEDELDLMEDKVEEAKEKKQDYRISLTAQKEYTQSILDMANSVSEFIGFDDIDDLLSLAGFAALCEWLTKKIAASAVALARAKALAAYIALVLAYYVPTAAASVALEAFYRNRLNYWSTELEKRENKYGIIKDKLNDCYSSLTECKGCREEYVDKKECGRKCAGCPRWYCTNCFDEAIESAELAAGEAF